MQRDPGSSPSPAEDLVVARGRRFTLLTTGEGYEIVDRDSPDEPVARFTGDAAGADAALAEHERLEHEDRRRPFPTWSVVLAVVFVVGLALWTGAGVLANARFAVNGNGLGGLAGSYATVQQLLAISRIGFFVWVTALAVLVFVWMALQLRNAAER